MSTVEQQSTLSELAKRIEGDIRARGLRPGDRYRTAAEAAVALGVSPTSAHRAMNLLVPDVLTRHHGKGTFVGPAMAQSKRTKVRTVHVLLAENQRGVTSVPLEDLVDALHDRLGLVNVQFGFVPTDGGVDYVRELIQTAQRSGQCAGVLAISCPRDIYRLLSETGVPLVVLGSLFPDQWHLPSVDMDYRAGGALLAQHLVHDGHRRIALLTTGGGRPGDNAFFDGISDALTAASLPHNALVVRIFPHDFEAFRSQTLELLNRPDRPTGIICASDRLVSTVVSTAESLGLRVPDDLEIVFQGQSTPSIHRLPHAHVNPKLSFRQIAGQIAGMLHRLGEGEALEDKRIVIPVEIHDPRVGT